MLHNIAQSAMADLHSGNAERQNNAYRDLIATTEEPVDWAYDVWDDLVLDLRSKDNKVRAIAAQVLCNLAKSDPEQRMVRDFDALLNVTRDERFVTARHALQNLYKVGAAGPAQEQVYLHGMETRYNDCAGEKNATLIRYDIIVSLRDLYNLQPDEAIRTLAQSLIALEPDPKYRKKSAAVWKT